MTFQGLIMELLDEVPATKKELEDFIKCPIEKDLAHLESKNKIVNVEGTYYRNKVRRGRRSRLYYLTPQGKMLLSSTEDAEKKAILSALPTDINSISRDLNLSNKTVGYKLKHWLEIGIVNYAMTE